MLPTLFGIVVLTFILFNVAGGDPAAMKLGKQATAKLMEEFDLVRGYDKPLIAGNWGTTRAYRTESFEDGAGEWAALNKASVDRDGRLNIEETGETVVPAGFSLMPGTYRWRTVWSLDGSEPALMQVASGSNIVARLEMKPGKGVRGELIFKITPEIDEVKTSFLKTDGSLKIKNIQLRRKTRHILDSQFIFYLRQIARFDFGVSHETNQRVSSMILSGILPSLTLTVPIFVVGLILSITLALICAFYRDTWIDHSFVLISVVLMSVNYLVWIVLGQYVLGYSWRLFPVWGYESARYLILPCIIGVVSGLGANLRFYRTVMLDEMYRDYVRTAFAKGVSKSGVLFKHVLKNAMIPILTSVVMAIPFLYTGSILLETFFGIPGLGRMGINAINSSDVDVVRALVMVGAVIYVIANLLTDIFYAMVDPRIKLK